MQIAVTTRRAFLGALAAGVVARPRVVEAQPTQRVYRLGYLSMGSATGGATPGLVEVFRQALRELGWIEGRNLSMEYRFTDGRFDRLPGFADELVALKPDVVIAVPTPSAQAARNASKTIPIVGVSLTEPVGLGLVASLGRPGGNVTGVSYGGGPEIFGKQLELLTEAVPKARRVAVLYNPVQPAAPFQIRSVKEAARARGLTLQLVEARDAEALDGAFATMVKERAAAFLMIGDSTYFIHRARLVDLALRHRLPSMSTQGQWVEAGGLMSYAPSFTDLWRRAAVYVDKILRGARPADLPIEQPTTYELIINLKTARALALTIPPALLQRANVIQ